MAGELSAAFWSILTATTPSKVSGKFACARVAPKRVFLQSLHADHIQIPMGVRIDRCRIGRCLVQYASQRLDRSSPPKRRAARQQLVQFTQLAEAGLCARDVHCSMIT